jgi:hypothetical protein
MLMHIMPKQFVSRLSLRCARVAQSCVLALALAGTALTTVPALAQQDAVAKANALYKDISPALRSDTVLIPLLTKMQPAPGKFAIVGEAMLLGANTRGFAAATTWAQAAPQKAVLDALKRVTSEADFRKSFAWGMPHRPASFVRSMCSGGRAKHAQAVRYLGRGPDRAHAPGRIRLRITGG